MNEQWSSHRGSPVEAIVFDAQVILNKMEIEDDLLQLRKSPRWLAQFAYKENTFPTVFLLEDAFHLISWHCWNWNLEANVPLMCPCWQASTTSSPALRLEAPWLSYRKWVTLSHETPRMNLFFKTSMTMFGYEKCNFPLYNWSSQARFAILSFGKPLHGCSRDL